MSLGLDGSESSTNGEAGASNEQPDVNNEAEADSQQSTAENSLRETPPNAPTSSASRGSIRRRLSKQKETVDETVASFPHPLPEVKASSVELTEEPGQLHGNGISGSHSESGVPRTRQLVRGLALCGDDDTRLRPPPHASLQRLSMSHSWSRESTGTDYTDVSGIDLKSFVAATLHKNPRDRQMILGLERQLTDFVNNSTRQAYKFSQMSSYNRMLIHRVAVLFGLDHNVDNSGQCVVVNKTERTSLPDFEFSSLIQGNMFTDSKRYGRSMQSQEEIRDPSMFGMGHSMPEYFQSSRRTQSFEASNLMAPCHNGFPQWVNTGYQAKSFDSSPQAPNGAWCSPNRNVNLKKAGSFGGVPAYYRSPSVHVDEPVEQHPIHIQGSSIPSMPYTSNGTGNFCHPKIDELSESMTAMQIGPNNCTLPHNGAPTVQNVDYSNFRQPLYVQASPMVSPHSTFSPAPQTVQMVSSVHYGAPILYSQFAPASSSPYANYIDNSHVIPMQQMCSPSGYHPGVNVGATPIPEQMNVYTHQQQQLHPVYHSMPSVQYSPAEGYVSPAPDPACSTGIHHPNLVNSVDGGYGSLTQQDSLKESDFHD